MLRLATIGTSWITGAFIDGAKLSGKFTLTAVYSRDAERGAAFALKHGAPKVFTDLAELAASPDVDAVYIASPNSLHYEQAKLLLDNQKHVL